jgi:hypothetical protein
LQQLKWGDVRRQDFDGLLLPGGTAARHADYLESETCSAWWRNFSPRMRRSPPSAMACSRRAAARQRASVLYGHRTTALTGLRA